MHLFVLPKEEPWIFLLPKSFLYQNKMSDEYLRAFVIGSSFLIFSPFLFLFTKFIKPKEVSYSYLTYSFVAHLSLGIMNVFSLYLQKIYHLSRENRFLITSLFAPTFVLSFVLFLKLYYFTYPEKWILYIIGLYFMYFFTWNFTMYYLDKYT
jgi:hypothetical protein